MRKLLELGLDKYKSVRLTMVSQKIIVEPQEWAMGLEKIGILNLLNILHFDRIVEINMCVKLLISCVH